jgi:5-methylcytosine-specific restriction endonuclease McrA
MKKGIIGRRKHYDIGKNHPFFNKKRPEHSKRMKGKNNPNWNKGSSFEPYSLEWIGELKKKIRTRDNHICQNCGMTEEEHIKKYNRVLDVHHIDYNKQNCKEINLITTCSICNIKANSDRNYWFAYYTYIMENR